MSTDIATDTDAMPTNSVVDSETSNVAVFTRIRNALGVPLTAPTIELAETAERTAVQLTVARESLAEMQSRAERSEARATDLASQLVSARERGNAWQLDFEKVSGALREEATNRGWCSDYGDFVARINRSLTWGELEPCEREYTVRLTLNVSFTVTAKGEDAAGEEAAAQLENSIGSRLSYDIEDTEVEAE